MRKKKTCDSLHWKMAFKKKKEKRQEADIFHFQTLKH